MNEIPTPETDAFKLKAISGYPSYCCDFAGDMERRLTVAREALDGIVTGRHGAFVRAQQALTLTAPKS